MRYQRVSWLHELESEPVVLYSEIDCAGREVRKVEEYRDGRLDVAGPNIETGTTYLSETVMPLLAEINSDPQFCGEAMALDQFERVWRRALRWFDIDE